MMLFSPLSMGSVSISNRVVISPMCQYSADDGSMNDWHLQHAMQMAMSGAGMFVFEATAVERRGRITHNCVGLYSDQNENAMRRVLNAARSVATNDLKFAIQLGHAGRKASHNVPWLGGRALSKAQDAWLTSAPSSIPFTQDSPLPEELDKDEMQQIIKNFVSATKRAVRLGFSAIEFHGAHGYLIHEFISPISNLTDGQQFWLLAFRPSTNSTSVAIMFGSERSPSCNWTIAFGSSTPAPRKPRGR